MPLAVNVVLWPDAGYIVALLGESVNPGVAEKVTAACEVPVKNTSMNMAAKITTENLMLDELIPAPIRLFFLLYIYFPINITYCICYILTWSLIRPAHHCWMRKCLCCVWLLDSLLFRRLGGMLH